MIDGQHRGAAARGPARPRRCGSSPATTSATTSSSQRPVPAGRRRGAGVRRRRRRRGGGRRAGCSTSHDPLDRPAPARGDAVPARPCRSPSWASTAPGPTRATGCAPGSTASRASRSRGASAIIPARRRLPHRRDTFAASWAQAAVSVEYPLDRSQVSLSTVPGDQRPPWPGSTGPREGDHGLQPGARPRGVDRLRARHRAHPRAAPARPAGPARRDRARARRERRRRAAPPGGRPRPAAWPQPRGRQPGRHGRAGPHRAARGAAGRRRRPARGRRRAPRGAAGRRPARAAPAPLAAAVVVGRRLPRRRLPGGPAGAARARRGLLRRVPPGHRRRPRGARHRRRGRGGARPGRAGLR